MGRAASGEEQMNNKNIKYVVTVGETSNTSSQKKDSQPEGIRGLDHKVGAK